MIPNIRLEAVTVSTLEKLAAGMPVAFDGLAAAEGALPPPHVARRALANLARGCPPLWSVPFNIVVDDEARIVGGCGFKGAPVAGQVELGYGIAPTCWRRGFGACGVRLLLELAAAAGIVSVIAQIAPLNLASMALARRVGFVEGESVIDADGEQVVRWRWASG